MKYDVVGLGVSTVDLLMVVDELPGSELVQKAHATAVAGGGPVATALVALARLGAKTAMLDRLGDDLFGRMIIEEFGREGVDTSGIAIAQGKSSSHASILVRRRDGARAITFAPGDSGELDAADLPADTIRAARILHLNGRHWDASLCAAQIAREAGGLVSFDGGSHRFQQAHHELMRLVDICIVAEQYATAYTGVADPQGAAQQLLMVGPKIVVVTCGTAGSYVTSISGEFFHQPAFNVVPVVDTTGAGDAYHGAFLFGIARGLSLRETAEYASAAGAINTTALGGRAALPNCSRLTDLLNSTLL
ncbi:carbohydrate kinase family protein [Geomonas oryzae]|uniref:carbohydrate kinase family protein n=1 Tax=Geomonas oryzae TaxID=2364273 RepID=UPI00100A64FC|nr:PfkB family carbohydrate kinase [Geomonas oryzae]